MSVLVFFAVLAFGFQMRNALEQRQRIALLGRYLRNYQIESLMETLTQGYLRAMGESDPERRNSVWQVMGQHEERLLGQLTQLQEDLAKDQGGAWRASGDCQQQRASEPARDWNHPSKLRRTSRAR